MLSSHFASPSSSSDPAPHPDPASVSFSPSSSSSCSPPRLSSPPPSTPRGDWRYIPRDVLILFFLHFDAKDLVRFKRIHPLWMKAITQNRTWIHAQFSITKRWPKLNSSTHSASPSPWFRSMPQLHHIYFHHFPTGNPDAVDFSPLLSLPKLKTLAVFSFPISRWPRHSPPIESSSSSSVSIPPRSHPHFSILCQLTSLTSLRLVDSGLGDGALERLQLQHFTNLTELSLARNGGLSDKDAIEIQKCNKLTSLDVSQNLLSVAVMNLLLDDSSTLDGASLAFPSLIHLNVSGCFNISLEQFGRLCQSRGHQLHSLAISELTLLIGSGGDDRDSDAPFVHLFHCVRLQSLHVGHWLIGNEKDAFAQVVTKCEELNTILVTDGMEIDASRRESCRQRCRQIRPQCCLEFEGFDL